MTAAVAAFFTVLFLCCCAYLVLQRNEEIDQALASLDRDDEPPADCSCGCRDCTELIERVKSKVTDALAERTYNLSVAEAVWALPTVEEPTR